MSLATLENRLDHHFSDPALLEQALTHRSHGARHNERLEFLGDSVLNFVVAAMLFERYSKIDEGDLSRLRANLVKQASLADIAQRLELSQYLRLGEGELKSGGFRVLRSWPTRSRPCSAPCSWMQASTPPAA